MTLDKIAIRLAVLDARYEEVKRFADVLQRVNRLTGACEVHYYNRIQAIEIERDRVFKERASLLKAMMSEKPLQNS